jgi:hypothetical protein
MKKNIKKALFVLTLLTFSFSSHAQLGGMIKKAKNKVEKKTTEKNEKETQNSNSKENNTTTKSSESDSSSTAVVKSKPTEIDKSEGITSPIHQKYLNKIVFVSNEKSIAKKAEIESDFKSEFTMGEPIYFRFYLSKTIEQSLEQLDDGSSDFENNINLAFKFYINDVLIDNTNSKFKFGDINREIRQQWTTLRGAFKSVDNSTYTGMSQFEDVIRLNGDKFRIGKNKLKVEIYPLSNYKYGDVIASGEITLNVKNSLINPNDPEVCLPIAGMKDDVLLKKIASAHPEAKAGFKVNVNNMRITSTKWSIKKNEYGKTLYRYLGISAGYKDASSNKCYRTYYNIEQDFVGSNFLSDINFRTLFDPKEEINCGCLK